MQRSEEIERLMRELVAAIARGDAAAVKAALSGAPGTAMIGTAPDEYTRERGEMERVLDDSTPDADAHLQVTLDEVAGYIQDDVAWADGTGRFERDGAITPTRFTCVFRREDGAWRLVQAHSSIAVPNDRMFDAMFRQTRT